MSIEHPEQYTASRYEYSVKPVPEGSLEEKEEWLNQKGANGWRLIDLGGMTAKGTQVATFIRSV